MALTNVERQLRWRERNRALYNLRRRMYRKGEKLGLVGEEAVVETPLGDSDGVERPSVAELREMMAKAGEKPPETSEDRRPAVFRNDYGLVITEAQWNALQRKKERAKAGGYVIDEWSQ